MFEPFYRPEDAVLCVEASRLSADIDAATVADDLFFPLTREAQAPLPAQMEAAAFAPRSFRYGGFGDNILGMDFSVGGKIVSLGGQTLKNAAGYEWIRFLSRCGSRFGRIERLVLRLRPRPEVFSCWELSGAPELLDAFRSAFSRSPWSAAADIFDFEVAGGRERLLLEFPLSGDEEWIAVHWLESQAHLATIDAWRVEAIPDPPAGSPVRVQTLPASLLPEARELAARFGGVARGHLGNGFFVYQPPPGIMNEQEFTDYLATLSVRGGAEGGGVEAPNITPRRDPMEAGWEAFLREAWSRLP